jgi:hypothetical protein
MKSVTDDLGFTGYKRDQFGQAVERRLILTSVFFVPIFVTLILDYYQMFVPYNQHIFLDYANLSKVFVYFWHLVRWFVHMRTMA